jgi:hypothetical protein
MARKSEVVTYVTVTDDITGKLYDGKSDELGDHLYIQSYRVTFERLNESGEVISVAYTRDVDMHDDTFDVVSGMIDGVLIGMFKFVTAFFLGKSISDALYHYILDSSATSAIISLFGGHTSTESTKSRPGANPYIAHVREYAIAAGWTVSTKGKLSQELVITFQTTTGITAEKFASGERAEMPAA